MTRLTSSYCPKLCLGIRDIVCNVQKMASKKNINIQFRFACQAFLCMHTPFNDTGAFAGRVINSTVFRLHTMFVETIQVVVLMLLFPRNGTH